MLNEIKYLENANKVALPVTGSTKMKARERVLTEANQWNPTLGEINICLSPIRTTISVLTAAVLEQA